LACCRSRNVAIAGAPELTQSCPANSISMHEVGPWLSAEEAAREGAREAARKGGGRQAARPPPPYSA
jgi:hypothetical protein